MLQIGKRYVVKIMIPRDPCLAIEKQARLQGITDAGGEIGTRLDEGLVYQTDGEVGRYWKSRIGVYDRARPGNNRRLPFDIARLHAGEVIGAPNSEHEPADLIVAAELPAPDDTRRGMVAQVPSTAIRQSAQRII